MQRHGCRLDICTLPFAFSAHDRSDVAPIHALADRVAADAAFEELSAVQAGKAEVTKVIERARERQRMDRKTILFLDEIHRFNKAQQDALLPAVEDGTLTLIGATTENPYFEVNSALISR